MHQLKFPIFPPRVGLRDGLSISKVFSKGYQKPWSYLSNSFEVIEIIIVPGTVGLGHKRDGFRLSVVLRFCTSKAEYILDEICSFR
jgi:hypothetical protein